MTMRLPLFLLFGFLGLAAGVAPATGQTMSTAATTTQAASAATSWHAVEVLVFRDVSPAGARGETWPAAAPAPSLAHAVYPGDIRSGAYAALSGHGSLAANALLRLERNNDYAIVATLGWQQPPDTSRRVSFTPIPAASSGDNALSAATDADKAGRLTTRLTGTARLLSAGRRTYVALHLRLCEPTPPGITVQAPLVTTVGASASTSIDASAATTISPPQSAVPGEQCFSLNQRHKVEPGKLAYFDNPALGALVSVRPIKPPEKTTTGP